MTAPGRLAGKSEPSSATAPAIGDYALIGDCRSAALVSRRGSIDWLCLPDFSSPSVFARILDPKKGGLFSIAPSGHHEISRRYVGDTAVLETSFSTETGSVRLVDSMSPGDPRRLEPQREVLRVLEGVSGRVSIEAHFEPRPDYARARVHLVSHNARVFTCGSGKEQFLLRAGVPLCLSADRRQVSGRFDVGAGERLCFSLSYVQRQPAVLPPTAGAALARLQRTIAWWENWASGCSYDGPYRDAVVRSALTLKMMTFAPSGAVVAAPTTSLPEAIGGTRNWDYRYCWLRDAALTMRALLSLDLREEAGAFLRWLLHATALTRPALNIMYDIYGRTSLREEELNHLSGHRASAPVRIGNGAYRQLQLDAYGSVISAAADYVAAGGALQHDQLDLIASFARTVCRRWREPDHGVWEIRGERQQHTFSKLMCWLALDSVLRLSRDQQVRIDRSGVAKQREEIREAIENRGFNDDIGAYVSVFGGDRVDGALLLMSCLGFCEAGSERMRSTFERVRSTLGCNRLLYRYEHGLDDFESREGAFGLCSFWAVDNLAARGDLEEAHTLFRHLLGCANDLGLYGEEIDPATGEALGNFPQAFTHVGVINAATALAAAQQRVVR